MKLKNLLWKNIAAAGEAVRHRRGAHLQAYMISRSHLQDHVISLVLRDSIDTSPAKIRLFGNEIKLSGDGYNGDGYGFTISFCLDGTSRRFKFTVNRETARSMWTISQSMLIAKEAAIGQAHDRFTRNS